MVRSRQMPQIALFLRAGVLLALFLLGDGRYGVAQAPCDAETTLSDVYGLSRRGKSEVWITPTETSLRRNIAELPRLVDYAKTLQEGIVLARERNRVLWAQRLAIEETLKKKTPQLSPGDPKRKQLEENLKQLDALAVAPEKLGGAPSVQPHLIDVTNTRHAILLSVFAARRDAAALKNEYTKLKEDATVRAALSRLEGDHRLGPLRDYSSDLRRLDEYEQFVYSHPQPIYLQSGQIRVGAILNDRTPATFTWRDSNKPTLITATMAQRAGIKADNTSQPFVVRYPDGRSLSAYHAKLKSLRFGSCVLYDVDCYILPPEGEDRGAEISATAFAGYRVSVEPAMLRMRIEPPNQTTANQ